MRLRIMVINAERRDAEGRRTHSVRAFRVVEAQTSQGAEGLILDVEDASGDDLLGELRPGQIYELTIRPA